MIEVGDVFKGTFFKRETYFPWPENNTFTEEGEIEIRIVSLKGTEEGIRVKFEIDSGDLSVSLETEYEFTVKEGELVCQETMADGFGGMSENISINANELQYYIEGSDGDKEDEERIIATKKET